MDNLDTTADKSGAVIGTIDQLLNTRSLAKVGTPLEDPKLEKFCLIYSAILDRRAAWQLATRGDRRGKTDGNASARAWEALKREDVQSRLADIADYTAKSLLINKSQIIKDIQHELEVSIADIVDIEDGNVIIKDLKSIPLEILKTIQSIKQTKHGIEVKLYDKQKARDQLMKHLGMTQDDATQVNINLDLGRAMEEMHQRVLKNRKVKSVDAAFEVVD